MKMDFHRAKIRDQLRAAANITPKAEIARDIAQDKAMNIAGMGQGRFSKAADRYMGAEPTRRIDPNSPEGRSIAAKLGL